MIVEGAGSPAETNLRTHDIANMGLCPCGADVPVVLVGDIDRGHVIASLVGAHAVLDEADRARIRGFIINKFRGDASLFDDGLRRSRAARDGSDSVSCRGCIRPARCLRKMPCSWINQALRPLSVREIAFASSFLDCPTSQTSMISIRCVRSRRSS